MAIQALSVSQIFTADVRTEELTISSPTAAEASVSEEFARSRQAEAMLSSEVDELRKSLFAAEERTMHVAESYRRQQEIRISLLEAAHSEALLAKDEAIEEARAQRDKSLLLQKELNLCKEALEVERQTRDADILLAKHELEAEIATLSHQLTGSCGRGTVHERLLRNELHAIDRASVEGAMPSANQGPLIIDATALQELGQWASEGATLSEHQVGRGGSPSKSKTHVQLLSRLHLLEQAAEAASERFVKLTSEHAALRRRYRRLKQLRQSETSKAMCLSPSTKASLDPMHT